MSRRFLKFVLLFIIFTPLHNAVADEQQQSMWDIITYDDRFSTFAEMVESAGVKHLFKREIGINATVYLPTNDAFLTMPETMNSALRLPFFLYLFKKFYSSYLDSFSKITSRTEDYEFIKKMTGKYFEMFDDPINAMCFADFKLIMPSLLQMGDRMSSSFGIENRCPYLDRELIEFAFSLPAEKKIQNLTQKILVRNLAKKLHLTKVLKQEKKGLTIKFNQWFKRNDWNRDYYFKLLSTKWKKVYN